MGHSRDNRLDGRPWWEGGATLVGGDPLGGDADMQFQLQTCNDAGRRRPSTLAPCPALRAGNDAANGDAARGDNEWAAVEPVAMAPAAVALLKGWQ